eukprot:XP_011671834.1 PREDICTED: uncharacterized protein LOC105441905 [Strongylocentrotus purpuratus]
MLVARHHDIYSEKISESFTVQQCRKKLENKYLDQLCKIQMKPWDRNDYAELKEMHTIVTMVKKDAHGKDKKNKEILQNSVAEIFSTKVNGRLPARILISAPAGRGKTTAVAKMAHDWVHREKGSALEHLPLLFVVKFRNTNQLTSIGEAIKSQLLSDVQDLTPEGLENFIRKNQGICHIILDGLDEYAGISSSQRSSESNIVKVICLEEFPECRVLVTTRPHLENFFDQDDLPRIYTKMWIEGFSRDSSCEYINKFFALTLNPCKGQSLKDYLDEQPLIDELVKTPLFCLMICHLWNEGLLDSETTTQTDLLDKMNIFLMHYANERSKSRVKITRKKLKKIINQLGEVALTGLLDDATKLVFTPHDFRKGPATLTSACELGIVSKTTVNIPCLPQSIETTSTTIEFYHKLAQEHSAGKFLADQTHRFLLRLKISKLDRVLNEIKPNIGDYENLIRFAAGTDNSLCIQIMKALLKNNFLDESERYRILLDCSSETKGTQRNVSSLVERCVNAESIVLKSPTVYTVVGMQNLPKELKFQVMTIKFEGSTLTTDVTNGLWSCMGSFSELRLLTISDSSLSFPSSPPELPSVTKLSAERVTSQSYNGLLSSLPRLEEIDITIGDAKAEDISQIQTSLRRHLTGQDLIRIDLSSLQSEENVSSMSRQRTEGLGLLIRKRQATLSGVAFGLEDAVFDVVQSSTRLMSARLYVEQFSGSLNSDKHVLNIDTLKINDCQLSTEITKTLWSCLRSFTSLNHLTISDSSLSFPPSPPDLPPVTKLSAKRVTSQSYEGLLSSLPGLRDIDITIDDAERDIPQITAGLRRTGGQQLTRIDLTAPSSLPSEKNRVSRETMRGLSLLIREQTKNLYWLILTRVKCTDEEDLVELVECCRNVKTMNHLMLLGCGTNADGRLSRHITGLHNPKKSLGVIALHDDGQLLVEKCQLSTEMTEKLWSCLRSFTSLNHLTISNSSLSFPPSPPKLLSVTKLSAERVTSQSYECLLSSLPERDIPQITAGLLRSGGQQLTRIELKAPSTLPSEKTSVSTETMSGLGLLIGEETKNLQWLILTRVKCTDEEDLVQLVECCKNVKTMNHLM